MPADPRTIVSYVRRSSRMNDSQQAAMRRHADRYLLCLPTEARSTSIRPGTRADWSAIFDRRVGPDDSPLMVEIGSGTGDALVARALAHPDAALVAFEVFQPAVATTMGRLAAAGVDNVRLVMADGVQGLTHLVAPVTLSRLDVLFPDPWQKKRHHKRRLVCPAFAALVAQRLAPAGIWHLATDWADYAGVMREVLDANDDLVNLYPDSWAPRPDDRPLSRFETRGIRAGRQIYELEYRRRA